MPLSRRTATRVAYLQPRLLKGGKISCPPTIGRIQRTSPFTCRLRDWSRTGCALARAFAELVRIQVTLNDAACNDRRINTGRARIFAVALSVSEVRTYGNEAHG